MGAPTLTPPPSRAADDPGPPPSLREPDSAGRVLLVLPVAYNLLCTLLARSFDYPDILR
jgi:hypothetical protein